MLVQIMSSQTGFGEYRVHMFTVDTAAIPVSTLILPGCQEIHIHTQKECVADVLSDGNNKSITVAADAKYAAGNADIADSNARALAFVYQLEGENTAHCEDNV